MQPSIQEFWSGLPTPGRVAVTAVPSLVIAAIITAVRCGASRELRLRYDHISDTARSSTSREVAPNARLLLYTFRCPESRRVGSNGGSGNTSASGELRYVSSGVMQSRHRFTHLRDVLRACRATASVSQAAPRGENRAVAHHRRRFGLPDLAAGNGLHCVSRHRFLPRRCAYQEGWMPSRRR